MKHTNPTDSPTTADVAAILEQLRAEIRAARATQNRDAHDPATRALYRSLDDIEISRVVSAHWPLTGRTLPRKIMALINKVVRRYLRWYINPIVEQQNAFNDATARAVRLLAESYEELAGQIAEVREAGDQATGRPGDGGIGGAGERESGGPREQETEGAERDENAGMLFQSQASPSIPHGTARLMEVVRHRAAQEPEARFIELELNAALTQTRLRRQVNAHWPLTGQTAVARLIALHQRVVRQYLRWMINPIVEQQNAANDALVAALENLARVDAARRADIAALRARRAFDIGADQFRSQ